MRSTLHWVLLVLISAYVKAGDMPTLVLNDTNEPPFTTPQKTGFLDVIASEAFRRAGARLQLIKLPAERGLINANAGINNVRTYQRLPEKVRMKDSRYKLRGKIHRNGLGATSCVIWLVTASKNKDASPGRSIHFK